MHKTIIGRKPIVSGIYDKKCILHWVILWFLKIGDKIFNKHYSIVIFLKLNLDWKQFRQLAVAMATNIIELNIYCHCVCGRSVKDFLKGLSQIVPGARTVSKNYYLSHIILLTVRTPGTICESLL